MVRVHSFTFGKIHAIFTENKIWSVVSMVRETKVYLVFQVAASLLQNQRNFLHEAEACSARKRRKN
jgi:hypothetical protein